MLPLFRDVKYLIRFAGKLKLVSEQQGIDEIQVVKDIFAIATLCNEDTLHIVLETLDVLIKVNSA